jgi:hypothetical protein
VNLGGKIEFVNQRVYPLLDVGGNVGINRMASISDRVAPRRPCETMSSSGRCISLTGMFPHSMIATSKPRVCRWRAETEPFWGANKYLPRHPCSWVLPKCKYLPTHLKSM